MTPFYYRQAPAMRAFEETVFSSDVLLRFFLTEYYITTDKLVKYDFPGYTVSMVSSTSGIEDSREREPRGARRKRVTRSSLLQAAYRLMAERGVDAVAINEITEAADVGFGSFYNHFESKEAIYAAVVDWLFEDFGNWIDRLVADVTDPAEVLAIAVRHTMLRAQREPLWGQFLIREGFSARAIDRGLGRRLLRDIRKGIEAGRFSNLDDFMSLVATAGTVLAALAAELTDVGALFDKQELPERTAAAVLLLLGLDRDAANTLARKRLPE